MEVALKASHQQRLDSLEQTRRTLPPLEQSDDVDALLKESEHLEARIKQWESEVVVQQQAVASVAAQFEVLAMTQVQIEAGQTRIEQLSKEISQWVLLTKALGTDGIVAMSIEDAGPAIAGIANTLLDDCYGGRFALSLVTQKDTLAGITKETFKIQVEDNHRGEHKLLDDMSGGEKVWINECLVRAMALYMAQVADIRSQTLFSDESDGALDPQRKRQYMAMKRAVMARGGYEREYLITQTPELLEMCDAVIDVSSL
jgi:exonuclease SbcC